MSRRIERKIKRARRAFAYYLNKESDLMYKTSFGTESNKLSSLKLESFYEYLQGLYPEIYQYPEIKLETHDNADDFWFIYRMGFRHYSLIDGCIGVLTA